MKKRIMILGAGVNQLALVRAAQEMGCYTITVDYLPENICHAYSDESVIISTIEKEQICKAATALDIDAVMTIASDVAVPSVAYLAEQLNLPGCSFNSASLMAHKNGFRRLQREARIRVPHFGQCDELHAIHEIVKDIPFPVIVKPAVASGSRGISLIDTNDSEQLEAAFRYAAAFSLSNTVCVEEFLKGEDGTLEGIIYEGKIMAACLTRKHMNGFIPLGHVLPSGFGDDVFNSAMGDAEKLFAAAHYTSGPFDLDLRVSKNGITFIEGSPRLGGNAVPHLVKHHSGMDYFKAAICCALGRQPQDYLARTAARPCGSYIFGSSHTGRLAFIKPAEAVRVANKHVLDLWYQRRVGDDVCPMRHSGDSIGTVVFALDKLDFSSACANLYNQLSIQITTTNNDCG